METQARPYFTNIPPMKTLSATGPSLGPVVWKLSPGWAEICRHLGLDKEAAEAEEAVSSMERTALSAGWDGAWFRRAYDAFGNVVGGRECEEGQIFIEPQGMCAMAGVGKETGEAARALESVRERLDTKYGIVLLQPA